MSKEETTRLLEPHVEQRTNCKEKSEVCVSTACSFPTSIPFIIGNEFCERFNYYAIQTIMVLYMTRHLDFSEDSGTAMVHSFTMVAFFTPIIGGILADGYWGKYKTILILSIVYICGGAFVSLTAIPIDNPDARKWVPFIGFLLVALGTGGIKPCVLAFGGDQFDLRDPAQYRWREKFFSMFYFSLKSGSMVSMFLTPILRGDVRCFGGDCYPLAFGVPAVLMIIATLIFVAGSPMYKHVPLEGNIIGKIFRCILHARRSPPTKKTERYLDRAVSDEFPAEFVDDVYKARRILVMMLPMPAFWALFTQQYSRWTLQATRMDGDIGFATIKPDQMPVLNSGLILIFIPIFESFVYPAFELCKLPLRPLRRMVIGMLLGGASFALAGIVQLKIDDAQYHGTPLEVSQLRVINSSPNDIMFQIGNRSDSSRLAEATEVVYFGTGTPTMDFQPGLYDIQATAVENVTNMTAVSTLNLKGGSVHCVLVATDNGRMVVELLKINATSPTAETAGIAMINGAPNVVSLFTVNLTNGGSHTSLGTYNETGLGLGVKPFQLTETEEIAPGKWFTEMFNAETCVDGVCTRQTANGSFQLQNGAMYTLVAGSPCNGSTFEAIHFSLYMEVSSASVSMLWQIPQYVLITFGEIMFSITGLHFAYSQAPQTMKSLMQSAWYLTIGLGNMVVLIISEVGAFHQQYIEFFFFAGLTGVAAAALTLMSMWYKYVDNIDNGSRYQKSTTEDESAQRHGEPRHRQSPVNERTNEKMRLLGETETETSSL